MKFTSVKSMFLLTCLFLAMILETQAETMRVDEAFSPNARGEPPGVAADSVDTVANQYIVKFKPGADAVMPVKEALMRLPSINALLLTGETPVDTDKVEYIEPNYILTASIIPNDPDFSKLWGLESIGLIPTWDIIKSSEILIAVIDSGIDYTHPDLATSMWTNPGEIPGNGIDDDANGYIDDVYGFDFANGDGDPSDDFYHGTHCAGTIAAVGNNGTGVVGVNWTAKLMALKFLDKSGFGDTAKAISAIEYAIQMKAKILNNSWGGSGGKALREVIQVAQDNGILFIAAAGNETKNTDVFPHYPASYDSDNIISVAAIDRNNVLATFSNFGAISVDLVAPGVEIYSTVPPTSELYKDKFYGFDRGTSMATPHVTGVAALVWAANPTFTYQQVKDRILSSVDPVSALSEKTVTGGKLNAYRAVTGTSIPIGVPVASCEASGSGMTVTFDGSKSRDTNEGGYLTSYLWTFANQADTTPASGDKMTTVFETPGIYVATLTVTDNDNLTDESQCNVKVPWREEPCPIGSAPISADFDTEIEDNCGGWRDPYPPIETCGESGLSRCSWTVCKETSNDCLGDTFYEGCKFSEVFKSEGTYRITPMLTCNDGKTIAKLVKKVRVLPSLGSGFAGGISVNGDSYKTYVKQQLTDMVDVVGEIKPTPAHVNQLVDIVVYALYPQYPTPETGTWFMLDSAGWPLVWDDNPATLVAFNPQVPLISPHLVTMYKGQFVLPGHLLVYFGYRLPDGTLVNTNTPIDITINQ